MTAALFFAYRAVRMLLQQKVHHGSVGVKILGFVQVNLSFGDHEDSSAVLDNETPSAQVGPGNEQGAIEPECQNE
ncbi:hypothetical protein [Nonomuraea sp. NPDC052265]|uniref:hypothetical protein n=1 Tax=Nonomuraea sp. NPDC052265 TaxID=3364374 RepID=UPI0037CAB97A